MEHKFDFDKNLEFLTDTKTDLSNIELQKLVLNSDNYNKTFKLIEEALNLMYEKTRVTQDLIEYSTSFIKNEIDEGISECKSLLENIENNRDLIKDSAYINYNIKLQSIFDTYSDRNNAQIKGVHMHNGVITLNSNSIEQVDINHVSIESKNINYNIMNTKDDIISNQNYRSFYMFDRTQKDPIKERILINFPKVKTINKVNITPSNCSITSIEYILENGSIETIEGYNVNMFKNRNVKSIAINIECKNYMTSQIDYNEHKDEDFWELVDKIKNDENLIVDNKKFFYYLFGLDKISIQYVEKENTSCFVSKEIKIESLKENEYIALESDFVCEKGNIEFYIIDGTTEIPILIESQTKVEHEKVFYKIPTRFTIEDISTIEVFKNGIPVKISLNEAMNDPDESYTVSYKPKSATIIDNLMNNSIKVKAIIRNYDNNYIPYIKSIRIKKYGGGSVWLDNNQM